MYGGIFPDNMFGKGKKLWRVERKKKKEKKKNSFLCKSFYFDRKCQGVALFVLKMFYL